jgi:Cu/Ag efflux pump CusA
MTSNSFFQLCIQRPVLTTMMSLAILVFGGISLSRLPVRELPDADPTLVNVLTVYPGASAEVVETEVTERIEEPSAAPPGSSRSSAKAASRSAASRSNSSRAPTRTSPPRTCATGSRGCAASCPTTSTSR